ncbi:MAG: DUF1549 domain-containing protein, partial [Planctomycetes bacterium]|nr:DUF1549 domain-containing protein [Planctomycetota bacterium]
MKKRHLIIYALLANLFAILTTPSTAQTDADHSPSEFFESRIRPVLVESCYKCHSQKAEKLKANLTLDSKAGWEKGGDSGPAIIPFYPDKSLLIKAIRHDKGIEPMPPKATLSARIVKDFEYWIKQGAFDPRTTSTLKKPDNDFDLNARKQWWSLYKITDPKPPPVKSSHWINNDIDAFILRKLEEKNLSPTHPADKTTLIRRATFLLTGLPPTPADVQTFLTDKNPDAYSRLIDKLLASEAFGERWARHWLDLVRYAETRGHEFDLGFPNPWRYRDYLIRAFNNDVPYDQFLMEHLAGDLIESPRLNPVDQSNESVIGPGFLNLGSRVHAPTDIRDEEIVIIDNQIDIVSKTFQALTVSCARCHDHKFDAITTKDYYSWYGIFSSSRYSYHNINSPKSQKSLLQKLILQKQAVQDQFKKTASGSNIPYDRYLSTAVRTIQNFPAKKYSAETVKKVAQENQLSEPLLTHWIHYLAAENKKDKTLQTQNLHFLFAKDDDHKRREFDKLKKQTQAPLPDDAIIMGDFLHEKPQWFATGLAFTDSPNKIGELCLQNNPDFPAKRIILSPVSSAAHSSKFAGCLQ